MHTTTPTIPWFTLLTATWADAWSDLQRRWQRAAMTADERYLRNAEDLPDLERRLKQIERGG